MRLGVVGCGDAAEATVLASRLVRRCRVTAVADPDEGRRERMGRRLGARRYAEWRAIIDEGAADALYVAVPHDLHRTIAVEAAAAGIPVLLEKPLARTAAEGRALLADLQAAGRNGMAAKVGVNYQYRYDPAVARLIEATRDGAIGQVAYASVTLPWHRSEKYFALAGWHASRERSGGGTLLTQGSHLLDAVIAAVGRPVAAFGATYRRVHRESEVEDLAIGVIECSQGIPIAVTSSMVSNPETAARIDVYGTSGSLHYSGPRRARLTHRRGDGLPRLPVRSPFVFTQLHAYVASLAGFRDWIEGRAAYRCTASDALPVLDGVSALYESAERGCRIAIADG